MDKYKKKNLINFYNRNPSEFIEFAYTLYALGFNHAVDIAEGVSRPIQEDEFKEFIREYFQGVTE